MSRTRGFTLIELSIVLVIIGLLVGGVLVGNDLIGSAKVRKDVSLIESVQASMYAFKNKYNGLPGDMTNPTAFFDSYAYTGDGNGSIGAMIGGAGNWTAYDTNQSNVESSMFWDQLARAGLIGLTPYDVRVNSGVDATYPGKGYPALSSNSNVGLSISSIPGGNRNFFIFGATNQYTANQYVTVNGTGIPASASGYVDTKIDDANGRTGRVLNKWEMGDTFSGANCSDGTTGVYLMAAGLQCSLRIESGF